MKNLAFLLLFGQCQKEGPRQALIRSARYKAAKAVRRQKLRGADRALKLAL